MTKRILIFSLAYEPFVGGAELAIKEITNRLSPSDYEFDMITLRFDSNLPRFERLGNITLHRIGFSTPNAKISDRAMPFVCKVSKVLFPITSCIKAVSLHRRSPYQAIWAMMANHAGFGALFFKLLNPRIPYILELQDGNSLEQIKARQPFLRLVWNLYTMVYRKADIVKAISCFLENLARGAGYTGKLVVIPNGVDVEKFSARIPETKLLELKKKFGKGENDTFLFTASRLVLSRGVEDVIRALPHLPPQVKFLIAGSGEDLGKLKQIARESSVEDRVIFAGHVSHADLPAFLKISDIFVRPSIIEGFGSAFVEAFASGIPVIATPVGGIPDFLQDGVTGLFCEVRNPESIARAVERYLSDEKLRAHVVANAQKLARDSYDWNKIAGDMQKRVFEPMVMI